MDRNCAYTQKTGKHNLPGADANSQRAEREGPRRRGGQLVLKAMLEHVSAGHPDPLLWGPKAFCTLQDHITYLSFCSSESGRGQSPKTRRMEENLKGSARFMSKTLA